MKYSKENNVLAAMRASRMRSSTPSRRFRSALAMAMARHYQLISNCSLGEVNGDIEEAGAVYNMASYESNIV